MIPSGDKPGKPLGVLLVNPGNDQKIEVAIHKRFLGKDFIYPPLGILSLAAWLRQHQPGHQVRLLDLQLAADPDRALRRVLAEMRPDLVGLTLYTNQLLDALKVCRAVRESMPKAKVVAGGPHVQLFPDETMTFADIDFAVRGEGEIPLTGLLRELAGEGPGLESIAGLSWRDQGTVRHNPAGPLLADLDHLPPPARDMLPVRSYRMLTGRRAFSTTTMSSRGCPHRCTFCDVPKARVRLHSPEWVVADIKSCLALGIKEVHFFDDMFNHSPRRVAGIAQAIVDSRLSFDWSFRGRVDRLERTMLQKARQSGCYRVYLGLEAGTDRVLGLMNKGFSVEEIRRGVATARQAGLEVHGYFMVGFPGESLEEMKATIDLACSLDLDFVQFSVTTYLPGTQIYDQALEQGVLDRDLWREQALAPSPDFKAPIAAAHTIGEKACWDLVNRAYHRFYFRPRMILKNLASVRSPAALLRRAWAARLCLFPHG